MAVQSPKEITGNKGVYMKSPQNKQGRGTSTWHKQGGYHEWKPPCLSFGVMRALWHYKIRLVLMRYY